MAILLFAGSHYYPEGGCNDLKGVYDTLKEAKKEGYRVITVSNYTDDACDWYNIMDGSTGEQLDYKHRN